MSDVARVTITLPAAVVLEIGRFETNRSRFVLEAVRRELRRRQKEMLRRSLANPIEAAGLVEEGFAEWAAGLPAEDAGSLIDPRAGRAVRWVQGKGWVETRK